MHQYNFEIHHKIASLFTIHYSLFTTMNTPSWFLKRNFVSYLLWPLSMVYFAGQWIVFKSRLFHANCSKRPGNKNAKTGVKTPVICIGGLLAGGVGKTPIVGELAGFLPNSAVVMRGYGRKGRETRQVKSTDTAESVGDEAKMMASTGRIAVFVGKDRRKSIKNAKKAGFSTIVMDDGFQNPTIHKDLSILVFDGKIGFGNGFMLPAGPLREPLSAIKRADAIIIIKRRELRVESRDGSDISQLSTLNSLLSFGKPVFSAKTESIDPGIAGNIVAFAGLGYPQKFFDSLHPLFGNRLVATIPFPDHYAYAEADVAQLLEQAGPNTLVTTAKDWVKIPKKYQNKIKVIPLKTTLEPEFLKWIKNKLEAMK